VDNSKKKKKKKKKKTKQNQNEQRVVLTTDICYQGYFLFFSTVVSFYFLLCDYDLLILWINFGFFLKETRIIISFSHLFPKRKEKNIDVSFHLRILRLSVSFSCVGSLCFFIIHSFCGSLFLSPLYFQKKSAIFFFFYHSC